MSLLRELVNEMAAAGATGAGAIAAVPGGLFRGGMVRRNKKKKMKEAYRLDPSEVATVRPQNAWSWRIIGEMMEMGGQGQREETTFDPADVLSKLQDAERRVDAEDDTVPFGMEDEDGNLVKVYVRAEQADEFESTLASMLAGEDMDNDEDMEMDGMEIAEVLFQLKDKFDIVDVEWPQIEGDEEEEQGLEGGDELGGEEGDDEFGGFDELEGGEGGEGGDELGLEGGDEEMDLEGEGDEDLDMEAEDSGVEGQLQQVIDMLMKDAEARTAESEARKAEAEARAAEANANAASAKVKQEEQVLDMEAYNADQKSQDDETKRLAQLAKYQHDQAGKAQAKMAEEEEERKSLQAERAAHEQQAQEPISVQRLADELIRRLQGNIR